MPAFGPSLLTAAHAAETAPSGFRRRQNGMAARMESGGFMVKAPSF